MKHYALGRALLVLGFLIPFLSVALEHYAIRLMPGIEASGTGKMLNPDALSQFALLLVPFGFLLFILGWWIRKQDARPGTVLERIITLLGMLIYAASLLLFLLLSGVFGGFGS